jgi:hypothetical protein
MRHGFGIAYEVIVRDSSGKITKRLRGSNSLLANAAKILYQAGFQNTTVSVQDTTNTARVCGWTGSGSPSYIQRGGAANVDSNGIQVGSGTNAVAAADYALQTLIAHGVGGGQLQYQAQSETAPSISVNQAFFDIKRVFINGSGGDVNINEIGAAFICWVGASPYNVLFIRDKLSSTIVVPNAGQVQIKYTLYLTV